MDRKMAKVLMPALAALLLGGILYYVFCPEVDFVKSLDRLTGGFGHIRVDYEQQKALGFIRFYGLDLLWAFSLTEILFLFFRDNARGVMVSVLFTLCLGGSLEILQRIGMVSGTFDPWDMAVELAGTLLAALIIHLSQGGIEDEKA